MEKADMAIDPVTAAAKAMTLLPKGLELVGQLSKKIGQRAQYDFRTAHIEYCCNVIQKFCKARTFFVRDDPQFLEDFYVPASIIKGKKQRIERANLDSMLEVGRKSIVTGNGGSGKTIFMRYLLLDAIERGIGYPVFIELRNLNELDSIDLEQEIVDFMVNHGFPLGREFALQSLREGLLVVLLDGFDEVVFDKRKQLERAIKKLGSATPSRIVLSSRPDMVLEGWDGFGSAKIAPLELDEACELIQKIRFDHDDEVKGRFIKRLKDGLFKSHQYFLSNPLLLSIMLLTYGDSADIPKKFASFYEQAFTALFQKHDALKSGYKRQRNTDFDIYEFARLFSAFSAITYDRRAFRFSLMDAVEYVKQAKLVSGTREVDPQGFLEDARQSVCLLVEDGLDLAYVHRSFQEYFVARFIFEANQAVQQKYIERISADRSANFEQDNVMKILYEMAPGLVEEFYLIPRLERLLGKSADRKISIAAWAKIFRQIFSAIHAHEDGLLTYSVRSWGDLSIVVFVLDNCISSVAQPKRTKVTSDLSGYFGESKSITFKSVGPRSPLWRDLAEAPGGFSLKSIETVRTKLLDMRQRVEVRSSALGGIFSFAAEGA